MMFRGGMYKVGHDDQLSCTVLQAPYQDNVTATFVLPDAGRMQQVEEALCTDTFDRWKKIILRRYRGARCPAALVPPPPGALGPYPSPSPRYFRQFLTGLPGPPRQAPPRSPELSPPPTQGTMSHTQTPLGDCPHLSGFRTWSTRLPWLLHPSVG